MSEFNDYLNHKRSRHGDKFDVSELWEKFRPHFRSGQRIKVRRYYPETYEGYTRTGTVGVTTGTRPAFLLMHRSDASGSSDVLSEKDEIVAVQRGRKYVTIKFCQGETGINDPRCGREWGHDGPCDWKD